MTELQIKYANLLLDREKTERELALNERNISEVERHNLATEAVAAEQNKIAWHQADSARMNADTNRLNYGVNYMNAETNRLNYGVNYMNAETNRLNYGVNAQNARTNALNAQTNARNAAVNERNAAINAANYQLAKEMQQYRIQESLASAEYTRQQAADLQAKTDAGYWESSAWSNYNGGVVSGLAKGAGSAISRVVVPAVPSSRTASSSPAAPASAAAPITSFGSSYSMSDVFPLSMFSPFPSPLEDFIHYARTGEHISDEEWAKEHGNWMPIARGDVWGGFGGKFDEP